MQLRSGILLMLTAATAMGQEVERIIRNDFDGPHADGSYRWAIQTEGGIYHEQRGSLRQAAGEAPSLVVEGQYQYTAPDGQVIHVLYEADANGFRAEGGHIPTQTSAVRRAPDYLATPPTNHQ